MPQFIRAIVRLVSVLSGISVLVFLIVHAIPGDPAVIAAGMEASQETVERIRRDLGLDRPLPAQFARFVAGALAGDLGTSIRTGVPVSSAMTSPQLARVRTDPSGQVMRSSISKGSRVCSERWCTAITCSRSSGTIISRKRS